MLLGMQLLPLLRALAPSLLPALPAALAAAQSLGVLPQALLLLLPL
jgi:hypothetical protein